MSCNSSKIDPTIRIILIVQKVENSEIWCHNNGMMLRTKQMTGVAKIMLNKNPRSLLFRDAPDERDLWAVRQFQLHFNILRQLMSILPRGAK